MARIEITIPGERIVEEFTALVPQPTTPSTAQPVNVGLVEISQSQPTQLIPGPVGPQGPRGSRWTTGDGPPAAITGNLLGDMYLDDVSGDVWTWDGTAWVNSGTNIQGSPDSGSDILTKLASVDGAGSGLDADTLDGHDTPYFATQTDMTAVQGVNTTQDNRLTAIETKNTTQDNTLALKADIASPTFTGDPRAPTPSAADNDTSMATTAFVRTAISTYGIGPMAQPYSRVINGAMQHSQENGNTGSAATALNAGYYAADQWMTRWDLSVGTASGVRFAGLTPNNSANYCMMSVIAAVTSLAAANYVITTQLIEGLRVADLGWGAAGAKQLVLRFWVNAPAGTYSVAVINNANDRSYVAQYTTSAGAWEMKTIVIPGDVTGTWLKDTGIGLRLNFVWAGGSSYVGVTGWQAGGKFAGPGQATSLAASTNYSIADVGLYLDPNNTGLPPPWQMPDYASELAACMRYWQLMRAFIAGYAPGASGQGRMATAITPMRVAGAVSLSGVTNTNCTGPSNYGTTANLLGLVAQSSAAGPFTSDATATISARM